MQDFKPNDLNQSDKIKELNDDGSPDDLPAFEEEIRTNKSPLQQESLRASTNWRAAKSLTKLRDQLNSAFPSRSKASDGFIGDASHCPKPDGTGSSDHCPNIQDGDTRVVAAYDATHDPDNDCDMETIVEAIRSSKDSRIKYIIWNSRICNSSAISGSAAWEWRSYSGSNPHDKHAHFSVLAEKSKYDETSDWNIS